MKEDRWDMKDWIYNRDDYIVCKMKKNLSLTIDGDIRNFKKESKQIFQSIMSKEQTIYSSLKIIKDGFKNFYKPYFGQDLNNKSILIERYGGIGDLLYIQPTVKELKNRYPSCKIIFSCSKKYNTMTRDFKYYDSFLAFPSSFNQYVRADYHLLYYGVVERIKEAMTTNLYKLCAEYAGINDIDVNDLQPDLDVSKDKLDFCKQKLDKWGVKKFVLVQKSASSFDRTPPIEFWTPIFNFILDKGYSIIFTDSPYKKQDVDRYVESFGSNNMFSMCGETPTLDIAIALQSLSDVNLCCNTSMIPISHALGQKVLSIHGPFLGKLRTNEKEIHQWVDGNAECAPCFSNGNPTCRKLDCFRNIERQEVLDKLDFLMKL